MDSSVQVPRVISLARLLENWSFYACVISGVVQRGRRKLSAQRAQLNWLCRWEASARLSLCRHSAARRSKQAAVPTRVAERKVEFFFANFIAIIHSCKYPRDFDEIFKRQPSPRLDHSRWNESLFIYSNLPSTRNNSARPLSSHESKAVSLRKKNLSSGIVSNW